MPESTPEMLLFIVGVHRSGTSALCAALQASGFSFGDNLLAAQAGVNDEGFWEDARVVSINDALLAEHNCSWFTPSVDLIDTDWSSPHYAVYKADALEILKRGFGGTQAALKDPRFCFTLPFWLSCCQDLSIDTSTCVIGRAPLEIARSLHKRDGFPVGYGLRLAMAYQLGIESVVPAGTARITFDDLLVDADSALAGLKLITPESNKGLNLVDVLRADLRHHDASSGSGPLSRPLGIGSDLAHLADIVDSEYPAEVIHREFAIALANQSAKLTELGEAHDAALTTLKQRDADIEALAAELRQALTTIAERDQQIAELDQRLSQAGTELELAMSTVSERDEQITEFDRRLSKLGDEHSHALTVITERDAQIAEREAQLDRIRNIPGMGLIARRLLSHEKG